MVLARTGDRLLAQDVTGETFLRGLRRIESVSDQGRDVGAWFTTIARNLVTDHWKSSRYRLEQTTADLPDRGRVSGDDPEQAVIDKETAAEVRRCVEALPPDQRECLRLRFWQDLSVTDTAAAMGRSDNAVKALRHRAVGALRTALTDPVDGRRGPVPPPRETTDPLVRARAAVTQVAQQVAGQCQAATEHVRTQQLTRWHTEDQAPDVSVREHADDGLGVA